MDRDHDQEAVRVFFALVPPLPLRQTLGDLAKERTAWARWMPRLRRAFREVEKLDRRIRRLERQIGRLGSP